MKDIMLQTPKDEEAIEKPQVIARWIDVDGMQVLVRIQVPFDEPPVGEEEMPEELWAIGVALVFETWSASTKTVITSGLRKIPSQTEQQFAEAICYIMNNYSDSKLVEIVKAKHIDTQFKFQAGKDDKHLKLPVPPSN